MAFAAWRPVPAGVWHDDGVYVLVGRALADGHGLTYDGVVGSPPAVKFPPLYPAFLAVLWTLFRDVASVTLAATLANLGFLAVAGTLTAYALRAATGIPRPAALAAGGLAMVSGDVLRTSSAVLSEPLFLMLVALALALWPGAVRKEGGRRYRVLLSLLLVALMATRAAGLAIVLGFAIAFALRKEFRSAALVAGPALLSWLAWGAWSGARSRALPAEFADLLGPYNGWIEDQMLGNPGSYLARLPGHAMGVAERVAVLLWPRVDSPALWVLAMPLFALALFGWARSVRLFPPLAWSSAGYAGLLLVWPFLDRRLVVPLHMLGMALIAVGALELIRSRGMRARRLVLALVVGWAGIHGAVNARRIAEGWPTAGYRLRAERLAVSVEMLDRTAPEGVVVGAPEFWAALNLHGGWAVAPSVLFSPRGDEADTPTFGTPEAQERLWRTAGIDVLLLEQGGVLHGATLDRLEARCPGMVRVLAQLPPTMVVRLLWKTPCVNPNGGSSPP